MIYSQNGIEAQDFTAVDSGLNQLSRDPAVKYSQNQEDITFFSQDPVRERGGSARDSHSGNLPCAPATVQIAQNQEDTTFFSQYPAINTTTSTDINFNLIDSEVVVIDQTPQKTQKSKAAIYSGIWHELYNAGIGPNPRTRALARLPHMTAEYVRRHRLGLEAAGMGGRQWTGLLVRILESGQPPPELNSNERLSDCACPNPVENTVTGSPTPGKVHSRWR
jgi:hypothetical protein